MTGQELTTECGFPSRMKAAGPIAVLRKEAAIAEARKGAYQITPKGLDILHGKIELKFAVAGTSARKAWDRYGDTWMASEPLAVEKLKHLNYDIVAFKKGVPDILASKEGRLSFFEIKKENEPLSKEQKEVKSELEQLGFEVHVWRYRENMKDFEDLNWV